MRTRYIWLEWTAVAAAVCAFVAAPLLPVLMARPGFRSSPSLLPTYVLALGVGPALALFSVGVSLRMWASRKHTWRSILGLALSATWWLQAIFVIFIPLALAARERPHADPRVSHLKQFGYGCQLYAQDNGGVFPPDLFALFPRYIPDSRIYMFPRMRGRLVEPRDDGMAYYYVAGLKASDDKEYILAFEEERNHEGRGINVLFVGAKVEWRTDIEGIHNQLDRQRARLAAEGREMKIIRPSWSRWPERPVYPVTPSQQRLLLIALVALGVFVGAAGAVLVVRRRRRRGRTVESST